MFSRLSKLLAKNGHFKGCVGFNRVKHKNTTVLGFDFPVFISADNVQNIHTASRELVLRVDRGEDVKKNVLKAWKKKLKSVKKKSSVSNCD